MRLCEAAKFIKSLQMRLLRLQEAKELAGVKLAWGGEGLQGVRGGLVDAGLAACDLGRRLEAGVGHLGRLDDVQPHGRPLPDLDMVAAEYTDG